MRQIFNNKVNILFHSIIYTLEIYSEFLSLSLFSVVELTH